MIKVDILFYSVNGTFQAENFGNSFVLETYISEEVKKNIIQAVSCSQYLPLLSTCSSTSMGKASHLSWLKNVHLYSVSLTVARSIFSAAV